MYTIFSLSVHLLIGVLVVYAHVLSCFCCVQLFLTLRATARQSPLSMGFSKQEYWNRLLCTPPGGLQTWGSSRFLLQLLRWREGSLPLMPLGSPLVISVINLSVMSNPLQPPWTAPCQSPLSMGILQARILEWVAMLSSRGSSQPRD